MALMVEALGEWIAKEAAQHDGATHRLLAAVRELDAAKTWQAQGARSCAAWLASYVGWSLPTARDRVRVARRLGELPLIDGELRRGALSYCKVRALTRVATAANEATLVDMAKRATGAQLDRICRKHAAVPCGEPDPTSDAAQRQLTRRDLDDGFVEICARLHPEEALALWSALDRIVATTHSAGRAAALVTLAEHVLRGASPDCSPTEVVVTVEADTLRELGSEATGALADGTQVPAETARRLSCDCGVVHDSGGAKTRSIPAQVKGALLRRDQTCRFPGCKRSLHLEGHHVEHWSTGGKATLRNLVGLCSEHHRYVHEYGYRLELDGRQQPHFFDPEGRRVADVPPPASARPREWDSSHADFNWAADANASADRSREDELAVSRSALRAW